MADINQIISLGIGTPADIEHFILFGLNASPTVPIPAPTGAPRWPLALHLYESFGGALVYTFQEPQGLQFTQNEHGFESLTGFQEMLTEEAFWLYDIAPAKWMVLVCGGIVVWEGRLEDRKLQSGGFAFTAFGAKRAFDDSLYTALWSTKSFAGIRTVTDDEVAAASPHLWLMDNNNRVYFEIDPNNTYGDAVDKGMLVFMMPHRGETAIEEIEFDYDFDLPTDWTVDLESRAENFGGASVEWSLTSAGSPATGSVVQTLSGANQLLTFTCYNETGAPVTGATGYAKITQLRIKATGSTEVYADEIIAGVLATVNTLNSTQINANAGLVQSPTLDLPDVRFEDMKPSQILNDLAERGDNQTPPRQWVWGVWENQLLFFAPRGDNALSWFVDIDTFNLDSTLESLVNTVYTVYQDANGRTLRTTDLSDSESLMDYEITRRFSTSENTTSETKANTLRAKYLEARGTMTPRATLVLHGLFDAIGAAYPLWYLRAGDTVTIRNFPVTISSVLDKVRSFRITRISYDVDHDLLTPTPEFPLPTLEIQIAAALGGITPIQQQQPRLSFNQ